MDRDEPVVDLEERTWLPRHCRGDQRAFPMLLDSYRRPVYAYLVRCGVLAAVRDDLFQTVFLKIHAAAASYQPARSLGPWIFTIVANTARNYLREQSNHHAFLSAGQVVDQPDPLSDCESLFESQQTIKWLEGAIASLPLAQREALIMTSIVGLAQRDAAQALGIPLNTVKTHLRRARLNLAKRLAHRVGDDR